MDERPPAATAFAVKDGKFVAVGDDAEVAALRGERTRVIDARAAPSSPVSTTRTSTRSAAGASTTSSCAGTASIRWSAAWP